MITLRAPQRERSAPVAAPRPKLRVVDGIDAASDTERRGRSASGVFSTLLVILLFACVFGVVVFQVFLVQAQAHLDDLGGKISSQEATAKQLRLETAELESPERIRRDGERLLMIPPGDVGFLSPKADDDEKGRFDPTKETVPVPTTVITTPPAYPGSGTAGTGSTPSGGTTTATTKSSTPTTAKTTPTTTKTTPTTKAPTPTTKAPTTTTKPKTTTTVTGTR
jgi:cell division protein FtsL